MRIGFNPQNNYKQNFTALDIIKITKDENQAMLFESQYADSNAKIIKENSEDLLKAIGNCTSPEKMDVEFILKRVAKAWGLIK